MLERIKEHDRDIGLAHTQTSAVLDRDPHWYTFRVEEAIHIRLHPNNINRDSGIEIPKAWMATIKKRSSRSITNRNNNEDRNAPIAKNQHAT